MARRLNRGDIWLCDFRPPDKRRPAVILMRQALLGLLDNVIVIPITRTRRGAPTEVELGPEDGLQTISCANTVNVMRVPRAALIRPVGVVRVDRLASICRALRIATGC